MNLWCWLTGHRYSGWPKWDWQHGERESYARLHRRCWRCGAGYTGVVYADDGTGSRHLWHKAAVLVVNAEKASHPLWSRKRW